MEKLYNFCVALVSTSKGHLESMYENFTTHVAIATTHIKSNDKVATQLEWRKGGAS